MASQVLKRQHKVLLLGMQVCIVVCWLGDGRGNKSSSFNNVILSLLGAPVNNKSASFNNAILSLRGATVNNRSSSFDNVILSLRGAAVVYSYNIVVVRLGTVACGMRWRVLIIDDLDDGSGNFSFA
jgi:hypothetical protein